MRKTASFYARAGDDSHQHRQYNPGTAACGAGVSVGGPLDDGVHFIHDHLGEPFGVERVVEASSISRRKLETRFRDMLGCTPHEYLSRRRVERAKKLLVAPGRIKFHNVAKACGFPSVDRMRLVFQRVTGMTPLEYRLAETTKGH